MGFPQLVQSGGFTSSYTSTLLRVTPLLAILVT
jgi:hypothetical protein